MSSGASGEVVHCPKCNEDVPKTLYCLNCGYPLYKEGQPKEEKAEPEVKKEPEAKPEPAKPAEEDAVIMVEEDEPEEPKVEATPPPQVETPPVVEATPPPKEEPKIEPIVETPTQPVVTVVEPEAKPEPTPEPSVPVVETPSATLVVEESAPEPEETITPAIEPTPQVTIQSEPLSTGVEASKIEAVATVEENPTPKTFVPDPLTKDLLENLAKNITLKLKLVKFYRDGAVKEETFTKLFEGFTTEGKIWASRREEILRKLSAEIEEMEDAYATSGEALELLEVRRSIGEATADEYAAKAPAYRWDIDHFDNIVGEKRNKSSYLENISNALTDAEMKELRELASVQYNTLESLQISKDEFLAIIKDDLYEAIKILG